MKPAQQLKPKMLESEIIRTRVFMKKHGIGRNGVLRGVKTALVDYEKLSHLATMTFHFSTIFYKDLESEMLSLETTAKIGFTILKEDFGMSKEEALELIENTI